VGEGSNGGEGDQVRVAAAVVWGCGVEEPSGVGFYHRLPLRQDLKKDIMSFLDVEFHVPCLHN